MSAICSALEVCSGLDALLVSGTEGKAGCAPAIAALLAASGALSVLDISKVALGDRGVRIIAEAAAASTSLIDINLSSTGCAPR